MRARWRRRPRSARCTTPPSGSLAHSPFDVAWVADDRRRGPGASVRVAPLSSRPAARALFGERAVVLTSATLELGGSFEPDRPARSGCRATTRPTWQGSTSARRSTTRSRAILYVAAHLPPPGRDGASPAADGRARGADRGGRRPHPRAVLLDAGRRGGGRGDARRGSTCPSCCRARSARRRWCGSSRRTRATCLFGTLSLWQGVDVPGDACQLVVIDRLPFPRPDDPLVSARAQAVDDAGGNGFMTVSAPHAALRLAQGAGRLIRGRRDRGVVAVLDSRLATARLRRLPADLAAAVLVHDRPRRGGRRAAPAQRS